MICNPVPNQNGIQKIGKKIMEINQVNRARSRGEKKGYMVGESEGTAARAASFSEAIGDR